MQPTSLDVERATILARKALENRGNYVDVAVEIIPDLTEEVERGWVFFYQSSEYIRTNRFSEQLVGNAPIFVMRDGTTRFLPTSLSWEEAISRIA